MALPDPDSFELNEWTNEARDPESLVAHPRAFTWYWNRTTDSSKSRPGYSAASISSTTSHWSIAWIARWTTGSKRTSVPIVPTKRLLSNAQNRFIVAILGEEPQPELQPYCIWYISFLESKIKEGWTLFAGVLRDVDPHEETPCGQTLSIAFQVLESIVLDLARESVTLTDMVDKLYNNDMFRNTDPERSRANQLVLAAFGWISSLLSARLDPDIGKLQIINPRKGPTRLRNLRTFTTYEQTFDNNDQPFHVLLGTFGNILPQRSKQPSSGQVTPLSIHMRADEEWIELRFLCFSTLSKVTCIQIEWVDNLSLHLEFNSYTKVLSVFRLPSFCLLMCCCKKMSPLSRLFSDRRFSEFVYHDEIEVKDLKDFYEEVILTYRLLFGQDTSSYKHFNVLKQKEEPHSVENEDLLLATLCGESWENPAARAVYEIIGAEGTSSRYSPSTDFPFLGSRLLNLQTYVRGHNTNSIRAKWYDRRNASEWWTFWAVIIFGSLGIMLALIFGTMQTLLAIFQVIYAKEQLRQNTSLSAAYLKPQHKSGSLRFSSRNRQ